MGACFLSTVCSGLVASRSPENSLLTAFRGGPVSSPGTGLGFQLLSISSSWLLLELAIESPQASLVLIKRLERSVHLFPDGESGLLLPPGTTRPGAACYASHHDMHRVTRTLPPLHVLYQLLSRSTASPRLEGPFLGFEDFRAHLNGFVCSSHVVWPEWEQMSSLGSLPRAWVYLVLLMVHLLLIWSK